MFIIDLRNKLVSNYGFSVMNNNNVDTVHIFSHLTQYSNYLCYLKVLSDDESYVDEFLIDSEDITIEDNALIVKWTMGKVATQCKKINIQLEFRENQEEDSRVAQSRIVSITLGDTIDVSQKSGEIYPDILRQLQNQIDELKDDSVANFTMTYASDVLTVNLLNADNEQVASLQVAISTSTSFVGASFSDNKLVLTRNSGTTVEIDLSSLIVDLSNYYNKTQVDNLLAEKVDKVGVKNKVYGTDSSGNQTTFDVDNTVGANGNIVRRDSSTSQIIVPLTPVANDHASSKGYVDTFAKTLVVSIDSSTYVMTFTLEDKNDNTLSTQTIDLPLETMVVGGSYDDDTKSIILTLKNGNTITIPVSDLVDGLVSQTDLTNALSNYFTKAQIEASYYSSESVSNLSTMGELRAFINNINSQGKHCFFDLHTYIDDAYVCIVHCWAENGVNYCFVQDLINHKTYGDYAGYSDSTTISAYLSGNSMANIKVIKITDNATTLAQIASLLQEINALGDYVMFDVSAITTAMYLTTIYINGNFYRVFDSITGRTASGTSTTGLSETLKSVIEGGIVAPTTWEEIHNLVEEGNAELVWESGDELNVNFFKSFTATSSNSGLTLTTDRDTFVLKTSMTSAEYVFTYSSTFGAWTLNDTAISIEEYGIEVLGTPANGNTITVDVVVETVEYIIMGFNQEEASDNDSFTNSMTFRRKYCRDTGLVFDPKEAFFYNGTGEVMPAGTYHFLLGAHTWVSADVGKYFQFTLTQDLPVGGQLVWQQAYNATLVNASIKSYSGATSTTEIETCTMTEGQNGTYLGVINNGRPTSSTTGYDATYNAYLNQCQRALFGNNDVRESNIRQMLNSDQEKGTYAQGQNGWDRLASYVLTDNNGFLYDLDPNVRKYVAECKKTTETVSFSATAPTSGGRVQTNEKVWLLSREEIQSESASEYDSYPSYTYYHNLLGSTYGDWRTDSRYILINKAGVAQYYFLRSPYTGNGHGVRNVITSGYVSYYSAYNGHCRVECFAIK